MLFSVTQTTKVTDLARISLRRGPLHIDLEEKNQSSTVTTLSQVRCLPLRLTVSPTLHVPQKGHEKGGSLLLELQFREIPRGTPKLYPYYCT
jgi:hypothetical protein